MTFRTTWLLLAALAVAFAAASCSEEEQALPSPLDPSTSSVGGNAGGGGAAVTSGGLGGSTFTGGSGPYANFPEEPVIEDGLPADIADQFAGATETATGGPCVSEPTVDALVPRNWTPLFFEWTAPDPQGVFELTLEVDNQVHPLVVYTTANDFTIDADVWEGLRINSQGHDVELTVRGAGFDGTALTTEVFVGTTGAVHIAPVDAPGSVVYWTSSAGTSFQGFTIGDTESKTILTPDSAGMTSSGTVTTCVSCHSSSPDGKLLFYSRDGQDGSRAIDVRNLDGSTVAASAVSPSALALLNRPKQTVPLTTVAHYGPDDAIALSVMSDPNVNGGRYELVWTDLHATDLTGTGVLARDGDPRNVSSPTWSHDGETIAYVSSPAGGEGVIAATNGSDATMDIYTVGYNDKAGGAATPLPGASDPAFREFYPVYSPDDVLLAFNRTDQPVDSYDEPSAEVFMMPAEGGTPSRLRANDPSTCSAASSPGLTNSWARWAPRAEEHDGKRYYWLVFSSKRRAASNNQPQLYIAGIVTEGEGAEETVVADYPAVYVTSQNPLENNHTPAWDVFEVELLPPN